MEAMVGGEKFSQEQNELTKRDLLHENKTATAAQICHF